MKTTSVAELARAGEHFEVLLRLQPSIIIKRQWEEIEHSLMIDIYAPCFTLNQLIRNTSAAQRHANRTPRWRVHCVIE